MSQYFKAINLSSNHYSECIDYKSDIRLIEHAWIGNNFVEAVMIRLAASSLLHTLKFNQKEAGTWYGEQILWAGDYTKDGEYMPENSEGNIYDYAVNKGVTTKFLSSNAEFEQFTLPFLDKMANGHYVLANLTKNEFYDVAVLYQTLKNDHESWLIHPLPILTASGNGKGSGDYHGSSLSYAGYWAGDKLAVIHRDDTTAFKEISPAFKEGDNGSFKCIHQQADKLKA